MKGLAFLTSAALSICFSIPSQCSDLKAPFDFENSSVLPARIRNPRFKNLIMFVDEKIGGDGIVEPLGARLNKPVKWQDVIDAQDDQTQKTTLEGFLASRGIPKDGSAGSTTGIVNTYANVRVPIFAMGITDKLTLAVAVPVYHVEVNASTGFMKSNDGQRFVDSLPDPVKAKEAEEKMNDAVNRKLQRLGYEPIHSMTVNNIGDISVVGKYRIIEFGREAFAVKLAVTLPTGVPPNANRALDVPTGDGQWDIGGTIIHDHSFTRRLKLNTYAGYTAQLPDHIKKRIPTSFDDILSSDTEELSRNLGDIVSAGTSLQYQFDFGLYLAAGYTFQQQNQTQYDGTRFDPARYRILEHNTLQRLQAAIGGIGFNGIDLYKRGKLPIPFQVNGTYSHPIEGIDVTKNDVIAVEASLFF